MKDNKKTLKEMEKELNDFEKDIDLLFKDKKKLDVINKEDN